MDFQEVEFYNYTIRMTVVDGVEMYLVSDLLKQYNEINGTKKEMKHWLESKSSQELLNYLLEKTEVRNLTPHFADEEASFFEEKMKSEFLTSESSTDRIDIPGKIQFIHINSQLQGYIVDGALLHAILMWVDVKFADDIYTFLEQVRKANNEYLLDAITTLLANT